MPGSALDCPYDSELGSDHAGECAISVMTLLLPSVSLLPSQFQKERHGARVGELATSWCCLARGDSRKFRHQTVENTCAFSERKVGRLDPCGVGVIASWYAARMPNSRHALGTRHRSTTGDIEQAVERSPLIPYRPSGWN